MPSTDRLSHEPPEPTGFGFLRANRIEFDLSLEDRARTFPHRASPVLTFGQHRQNRRHAERAVVLLVLRYESSIGDPVLQQSDSTRK
ncbi:hypothetical protein [Nocardia sp. BMG51109]|uniref:hypothetical protein n=1 Tax=Nocardia sp. BMG51109 TaxID=1056816 RepID=UPI0018DD5BF0|nr:hypothetical protein [Nocardia sp. BMG51109]